MNKMYFYKLLKNAIENNTLDTMWLDKIFNTKNSFLFKKDVSTLIKDNFNIIIEAALNNNNSNNITNIIDYLYKKTEYKDFIDNNMMNILIKVSEKDGIFPFLLNSKEFDYSEYFNENFESYIKELKKIDLYEYCTENNELIYWLDGLNNDIKNKITDIYPKGEILKTIIKYRYLGNMENKEYNSVYDCASMIIDEVSKNEHQNFNDIKVIGQGGFSLVFLIGNKVVKLGKARETFQIPNHPRIIQPVTRINAQATDNLNFSIEVTEKVDTNVNISDEECYSIYKELRDSKIVATDFKLDNLGILLKDNIINWEKEISHDMSERGLHGENDRILTKGDIVLIDTDFVYNEENAPQLENWPSNDAKRYEIKYLEEKTTNKTY